MTGLTHSIQPELSTSLKFVHHSFVEAFSPGPAIIVYFYHWTKVAATCRSWRSEQLVSSSLHFFKLVCLCVYVMIYAREDVTMAIQSLLMVLAEHLEKKNIFDMVSYLKKRWLALTKRVFTEGTSSQAYKQMCSGLLETEQSHVGTSVWGNQLFIGSNILSIQHKVLGNVTSSWCSAVNWELPEISERLLSNMAAIVPTIKWQTQCLHIFN